VSAGGEGNLAGGLGLQPNVRLDLAEGGGRIKTFDVVRGLEDVMQMLGSEDIDEQQFDLIQDSLTKAISQLSEDKSRSRSAQIAFLRGLVADRNYFRRLIAVRVLARQQDLDNVPALIYALGDPDLRICAEAQNGLRLISRKLDSISVSDNPDYSEFQSVKRKWTDWYLKIRPGAKLLD
jgi:HEAT repeat protein